MKQFSILLLVTLSLSFASSAFAAKEVFERTKPHVNVGTIGHIETASLSLAFALAAGNSLEEAIDERAGTVTATVETADSIYQITGATKGKFSGTKASDAYFVKVDSETTTQAGAKPDEAFFVKVDSETTTQTREHILLARQVGVPALVIFLNVDGFKDAREVELESTMIHELLHSIGYSSANSAVVVGSLEAALKGEKEGLLTLLDLTDALDRCVRK